MREVLSKRSTRVAYFEHDFFGFAFYYFNQFFDFETPGYLLQYSDFLLWALNILFEGFRGSSKTTIAQIYIVWCIVYKKRRNIMRYSFNGADSEENIGYISNMLIGSGPDDPLIRDFGQLYFDDSPVRGNDQKKRRTLRNFVTVNEVYVRALSLGISPRGKNYTATDGKHRPDLLIFDDIDTVKSVASIKMIDKNWRFIEDEVLGGVTGHCQILFLGNTIKQDGLLPRMKKKIIDDDKWRSLIIPIYDDNHRIVWTRFVETDKEANDLNSRILDTRKKYISLEYERKRLGPTSYAQNYLLVPYVDGSTIIHKEYLNYTRDIVMDHTVRTIMGVDPAYSLRTESDPIGIVITHQQQKEDGRHKYIRHALELVGTEKKDENVNKVLYDQCIRFDVDTVVIEANNGGEIIARNFKKYCVSKGLVIQVITQTTKLDKVENLRKRETVFTTDMVHIHKEVAQHFIDQLTSFPNVDHDDMVDGMMNSFTTPSSAIETVRSAKQVLEEFYRKKESSNNIGFMGGNSSIKDKF